MDCVHREIIEMKDNHDNIAQVDRITFLKQRSASDFENRW